MGKTEQQLYQELLPVLISKVNEFAYFGYTSITVEQIWHYCLASVWREHRVEDLRIHQIVSDILSINPSAFMTHLQLEEQQNSDWFSELNSEELQVLLAPKQELEK